MQHFLGIRPAPPRRIFKTDVRIEHEISDRWSCRIQIFIFVEIFMVVLLWGLVQEAVVREDCNLESRLAVVGSLNRVFLEASTA